MPDGKGPVLLVLDPQVPRLSVHNERLLPAMAFLQGCYSSVAFSLREGCGLSVMSGFGDARFLVRARGLTVSDLSEFDLLTRGVHVCVLDLDIAAVQTVVALATAGCHVSVLADLCGSFRGSHVAEAYLPVLRTLLGSSRVVSAEDYVPCRGLRGAAAPSEVGLPDIERGRMIRRLLTLDGTYDELERACILVMASHPLAGPMVDVVRSIRRPGDESGPSADGVDGLDSITCSALERLLATEPPDGLDSWNARVLDESLWEGGMLPCSSVAEIQRFLDGRAVATDGGSQWGSISEPFVSAVVFEPVSSVVQSMLSMEDPHRRALHRVGLTDEQIDRSTFSPQVLEMLNTNLASDPTLQVLLEKRLQGRVRSIVGKKFDEAAMPQLCWVPLINYQRTKPPSALRSPDGDEVGISTWGDVIYQVAEWLVARGLLTARDCPVRTGRTRHPTVDRQQMVSGAGQRGGRCRQLSNGLFVRIGYGGTQVVSRCAALLDLFGAEASDFQLFPG